MQQYPAASWGSSWPCAYVLSVILTVAQVLSGLALLIQLHSVLLHSILHVHLAMMTMLKNVPDTCNPCSKAVLTPTHTKT